ncbi:Ribosomal_protein L23 [Hexamita inflata]|uniref:Ribosomal protein L23 n=1 Tax=Hexamita inflata TaxID=28002 RepID=A0AA86PED5_9EUKA|nr:Ribosomal protein L23 [Hexamita inflata]CAI9935823.1 Ribosomal protein L23 [Hexamita inflata]CAI9966538.1 Ribosomal protein L23 [Hexamita inflata]
MVRDLSTVTKATKKACALTEGSKKREFKIRTGGCRFVNPKPLVQPKKPVYERTPIAREEFNGSLNILRFPVRSEAINNLLETQNTVVFIVRRAASKTEIAAAFNAIFQIKPVKVNTLITPLGDKKAFIKLPKDVRAEDVAAGFTPK